MWAVFVNMPAIESQERDHQKAGVEKEVRGIEK